MADSRLGFRNPSGRAVTLGALSSTETPQLQRPCLAAHCSWPPFSSLKICTSCIDLPTQVRATQNTNSTGSQNLTFGYSGNGPGSYFNATIYISANSWPQYESIFGGSKIADIDYPIYAFQGFGYKISQLTTDTFQYELLDAVECAFFVCIKTYSISTRDGSSEQTILSSWHNECVSTSGVSFQFMAPIHKIFTSHLQSMRRPVRDCIRWRDLPCLQLPALSAIVSPTL